jgi:hypothetical protein
VQIGPLPLGRAAHAGLGVVTVLFGVGLWVDGFAPAPVARALGAALLALGAVVAGRGLRVGVECSDGVVRVRGLLRTRVVPRARIEAVTGFPALVWRDPRGRRRWTPMVFLSSSSRSLARYSRHNEAEIQRLRSWVRRPPS